MSATALALPRLRTSIARQPAWVPIGLTAVMTLAAVLCLWNLTISGMSNEYYAAATKSASESWKALFFGSLDPGSFITVDKPPLSLWLSGLSARALGFSSFSILLPSALCTIAAVGTLFATVRRVAGPAAGLLAAGMLATTPITVAIGRVNNPDALLVLLLVVSAYLTVRAIQDGRSRWLVGAGAVVGLAFMTKMLQGWMVVPALAMAYLLAGPPGFAKRIGQLALAGAAMVAVSAAWPLAVTLWPGQTPYIGGSTDGSVWNLILGYNGLGRIFGEGGGGGGMGGSFGGLPGFARMFNAQVGTQVAWLIPLAAIAFAAGVWLTRDAERTDLRRAGFVLFGVWAVVHAGVFSTQKGIFHPYYVSALAPALAALGGMGLVAMWNWARSSWVGLAALDLAVAVSAATSIWLLSREPDFVPWLSPLIGVAAVAAVLASVALRAEWLPGRRLMAVWAVAGVLATVAAPTAWSFSNLGHALNGNNVLAGPSSGGGMGGGGGLGGGLSAKAVSYLEANQGSAKYLVAANGAQATGSIIVSTGKAVVTIGGFSGQDRAPTVSQLAQMVKDGELKYVLVSSGSGGGMGGGPGGGSQEITSWVKAHGKAVSGLGLSGQTLYRVSAS